jgi:pantoate--beta-alanine ligase
MITPEEAFKTLDLHSNDGDIGLVPTMGFLHEGHLSLVRRCRKENSICIVSIFVNPIQFGQGEDLGSYPRDMDRDLELLEKEKVDFVFAPEPSAMYSPQFSTFVEETDLSRGMCGSSRPGHFRGVCTVVLKLLNIIRPSRAYFGEKDYQQLQVIRRMTDDLNLPLEVVGCPIVRDEDGLAMSSRNMYLSPDERKSALLLNRALSSALDLFEKGERSGTVLERTVRDILNSDRKVECEYVCVKDAASLKDIPRIDREAVIAVAARVGKARLIDNIRIQP